MDNACQRIMERIKEIREYEQGFDPSTMRWGRIYFQGEFIREKTHISEVDFGRTTQTELVNLFELILRRHWMQM